MTSMLELFYDGRKLFITLIMTLFLLIVFLVFKIEIVPYSIFLALFSRYFVEIHPIAFLIFYCFVISYVYSALWVSFHDLISLMIERSQNVNI